MRESTSFPSNQPRFFYGWIVVAVIGLAGFTVSAEASSILGVFLKPITQEFGWSRTAYAGSFTLGTLIGGLLGVIIGPVIDRFGGRWVLIIAFSIVGITLFLTAGITSLWQFYILQILGRASLVGAAVLALVVIIPKWFVVKRGRAVALGVLGTRIGFTVTPLYVQALIVIGTWRLAMVVVSILVLVVSLIPIAIFLRRRPEDMGLLPDGLKIDNFGNNDDHSYKGLTNTVEKEEISLSLVQVIRLMSFYLLITSSVLFSFVTTAINIHLVPYLTDINIDSNLAVVIVGIMSASGGVGAVIFGVLSDRYGSRLLLFGDLIVFSIGLIGLIFIQTVLQGIIWAVFYGLIIGGLSALPNLIIADYFGRESIGAIRGVAWPVQMVAAATGPLVAAIAFDALGSYKLVFTVFAGLALVSSFCVFMARQPVHNRSTI